MAHATVNAALALASNNNALAGAAGATLGEAMGMIALNYYGKNVDELSEQQKQTVSTLATLAAGLAGGISRQLNSGCSYWRSGREDDC